jgi:hypothetical protein
MYYGKYNVGRSEFIFTIRKLEFGPDADSVKCNLRIRAELHTAKHTAS